MFNDEIIEVYEKEESISKIVLGINKFSFDDLIKTDHFYYSLDEKSSDINFIKDKFKEFHRIKLVNKRKHRNQKLSYDFYYELDNGFYLLYSIALENKPILLNAFLVNRNFKEFKKNLLKAYKNKIIG
jgi:hypothetical protein